ncbi:MAG: hypothetical protein OSB76_01305 [Alphaproteobacteria bacterium]|nr:hypothetical protein [Alphaproteobacteria bacterium]
MSAKYMGLARGKESIFKKMLTALAVTTLSVGSAQALTIDNFTTNQLVVDGSGSGAASSTVSDIVNILGTNRTISVEQLGPGTTPSSVSINVGTSGLLTLGNTDPFSVSNISYNGIGGGGLGGVDVTEDGSLNAFSLLVVAGDFSTNIALTVSDGVNTSSLVIPTPGLASFVPLFFAYAPFVGGPVDFTAIDYINIALVTTNT